MSYDRVNMHSALSDPAARPRSLESDLRPLCKELRSQFQRCLAISYRYLVISYFAYYMMPLYIPRKKS